MATRVMSQAECRLREGFALDRRYGFLMGLPQADKEFAILEIARIFDKAAIPYAIMGGVAVQVHTKEPRTTLDLDVALRSKSDVPREALLAAGFKHEGTSGISDHWRAPGSLARKRRTAVQFSADALTQLAVEKARTVALEGIEISVVSPRDLVLLKIAAAKELRRRKSKRISDYGDIVRLLEDHPGLMKQLLGIETSLSIIRTML